MSKASRYGLYAVVMMAAEPRALVTAAMVADGFSVSEHHVAKVLQQLARAQIITGTRGVKGGYRLAVAPGALTMLDVVEALEGPWSAGCHGCEARAKGSAACAHAAACAIREILEELGQQAYFTLKSVTIATLARRAGSVRADPLLLTAAARRGR